MTTEGRPAARCRNQRAAVPLIIPGDPVNTNPDRDTLRQHIAKALAGTELKPPFPHCLAMADAVLAVLPDPTNRAAVLLEAADLYAKLADQNEAYELAEHGSIGHESRLQHETVRDMVAGLRRLAAEAQRPEPGPIARVRALHVPDENGNCCECRASFDPCPTIAVLDGEPYAGDERPCLACNHSMDSHIRVDGKIVCAFEDCSDPTPAGDQQDGAQPQEDHRG